MLNVPLSRFLYLELWPRRPARFLISKRALAASKVLGNCGAMRPVGLRDMSGSWDACRDELDWIWIVSGLASDDTSSDRDRIFLCES